MYVNRSECAISKTHGETLIAHEGSIGSAVGTTIGYTLSTTISRTTPR
jgi:hypothetical protein